jgi:hypothetical protein
VCACVRCNPWCCIPFVNRHACHDVGFPIKLQAIVTCKLPLPFTHANVCAQVHLPMHMPLATADGVHPVRGLFSVVFVRCPAPCNQHRSMFLPRNPSTESPVMLCCHHCTITLAVTPLTHTCTYIHTLARALTRRLCHFYHTPSCCRPNAQADATRQFRLWGLTLRIVNDFLSMCGLRATPIDDDVLRARY